MRLFPSLADAVESKFRVVKEPDDNNSDHDGDDDDFTVITSKSPSIEELLFEAYIM